MCVCLCVSVCNGSGKFGRQDYRIDVQPSYLLYPVLCNACAWQQVDALKEQQLKRTQLGSSRWSRGAEAEADANRGAVWSDHTRLVLARDTTAQGCWCVRVSGCARLTQTWWGGETTEAYLCLQRRENCHVPCCANFGFYTVKSCKYWTAHKGKWRAVWNRWTRLLDWPKLL